MNINQVVIEKQIKKFAKLTNNLNSVIRIH